MGPHGSPQTTHLWNPVRGCYPAASLYRLSVRPPVMSTIQGDNANCLEALDIALCVLSQVTSPRDLLAAGKVNHSFNRAVRENFLWQTVHAAPDSPSLRAFALSCHAGAFFGRPP